MPTLTVDGCCEQDGAEASHLVLEEGDIVVRVRRVSGNRGWGFGFKLDEPAVSKTFPTSSMWMRRLRPVSCHDHCWYLGCIPPRAPQQHRRGQEDVGALSDAEVDCLSAVDVEAGEATPVVEERELHGTGSLPLAFGRGK